MTFKYVQKDDRLILTEAYFFYVGGKRFSLYRGTSWNGANIPKFLQPIFGSRFAEENAEASLVHDYLITIGWDVRERDLAFYEVLKRNRGPISSWLMYQGVSFYSRWFL